MHQHFFGTHTHHSNSRLQINFHFSVCVFVNARCSQRVVFFFSLTARCSPILHYLYPFKFEHSNSNGRRHNEKSHENDSLKYQTEHYKMSFRFISFFVFRSCTSEKAMHLMVMPMLMSAFVANVIQFFFSCSYFVSFECNVLDIFFVASVIRSSD